jgi:hypothetical protein
VIRTLVLGLLGLAAAIAIGVGIHLVTRDTIALPVVRLEQGASLVPRTASTTTVTQPRGTSTTTTGTATDEDGSGRGRGHNRGRGGDDD